MGINMRYVRLFTAEGRLLKEIPFSELSSPRPDAIEYAGNLFLPLLVGFDYKEIPVYHYAEKGVTPEAQAEQHGISNAKPQAAEQKLDTV